ncbi:MAG: asparagine synthase [Nitrosomonas sp.]|nr:asparagine synthase [Nitrosomonas sp.]
MGGICGWTGCKIPVNERRKVLENMIQPIVQYDNSSVNILLNDASAFAIIGHPENVHTFQGNGYTVVLWGQVRFKNIRHNQPDAIQNPAEYFLEHWLDNSEEALSNIAGEFIVCIADDHQGQLMLAIDRLGTRSMAYQAIDDGLIFSTSQDALIKHPLATAQINSQSIYNYIYFHMIPGPDTIYKDQYRLLPGECLTFRNREIKKHPYWKPVFIETSRRPFEELKSELRQLLRSSVRDAIGNASVGTFLSGGTDSSTLAGILGEVTGEPAQTYSIGFAAHGYDEMEYARIAARHFSTRHHEYYVTPDDVVTAIPQIAAIFDQPFGNASAIPAYYCARMAKEDGLTRILGGDGGDELFGGNERYAKQYIFSLYERLPAIIRKKIFEPWAKRISGKTQQPFLRKMYRYIEQASIPMPARMETYNLLLLHGAHSIFTAEFLETVDSKYPGLLLNQTYHQTHAKSLINRMLAYDWKITLTDNDLPKVVKACELAQIDVAFPLISDEITAFSLQLRPDYKVKGTKLRYFFKEALKDFLPREIIVKQKHGFGLPFGVWLQEHAQLKALAADSLSDLKSRRLIRTDYIDTLLDQHLKEHASYHGTMIWILIMLECWYKSR